MTSPYSIDHLPPLPRVRGVEIRHIPGLPGYCVGDNGQVWSALAPNKKSRVILPTWHLKSSWPTEDGYRMYCLRDTQRREKRLFGHTLVLTTFRGPRPKGKEGLHWDGCPDNNELANLRWGTRKENVEDARRHGRIPMREQSRQAKLTELRVEAIKALRKLGWTQRNIAVVLGVSQPTISAVDSGKRWEEQRV